MNSKSEILIHIPINWSDLSKVKSHALDWLMEVAIEQEEYEKAAIIRNQIEANEEIIN